MERLNRHGDRIEIDVGYVRVRLEEAGACLMALPASRTMPAAYRTAWPEIVQAAEDWLDAEPDDKRPDPPKASAISDMDEVYFRWIPLVGEAAIQTKRLLWLRSLVFPLSGKNVWSYGKLEKRMGLNRETLRLRFEAGVGRIVTRLNRPDWVEPRGSNLP